MTNNLAHYRKKRGLTQEELSRIADLEQSEISRAENGLKDFRGGTWARLAKILDCSVEELMGKE